MVDKKYFHNTIEYKEKLFRVKGTLLNRLNLLNIFMPLIEKKFKPYTIYNININLNKIEEIEKFLIKNTEMIELSNNKLIEFFLINGSNFQKERISKYFIK